MMLKRYFGLAYLLLVTVMAILGAKMTNAYISARMATPLSREPLRPGSAPLRPVRTALADYGAVVQRNIFNANPVAEKVEESELPPPPQAPPQELQETQLQLGLVGTVTGPDARRYAIIADLGNRGTQAVYQVGDTIQQTLIAEIQRDCVVLDKNGHYEVLCFRYDDDQGKPRPRPSVASAVPAPGVPETDEAGIQRVDAATWRVSRDLLMGQLADFSSLATQVRVAPYMVEGQPRGFRFTRLVHGSMLSKIGLQNGDVIQKINGLHINSPEEALQAYQQLQNESTVRLEVLRRNRLTTFTYEIR